MADRGDGDYSFLRNALRRAWGNDPEKQFALLAARVPYVGDDKRCKWLYVCNMCKTPRKRTEVHVDHIIPCGRFTQFKHREKFLLTLFCRASENLQILCRGCHKQKSFTTDKEYY